MGGMAGGSSANDGDTPDFTATVSAWAGETATDAAADTVGTDKDVYHEANTFSRKVTVTFNGDEAIVENSDADIICHTTGAYVTLDLLTHSVEEVEIVLKGKSTDGGLKIYGEKKCKLTLSGVELTSAKGPALNNQCKKRIFVHLMDGTVNRLTDCAVYGDDAFYMDSSVEEDRKGCFFSEGNIVLSGTGTLVVSGKQKHAVATDGYLWVRPGVTLVVPEAAKNALHVKGDTDDNIGIHIGGGLIHLTVSSTAGKGIKTDLHADILGGQLLIATFGNGTYDADEKDTSSAAAVKSDGDIRISGGTHLLTASGTGGKGLNADGQILVSGGGTTVITTGKKYSYTSSLTSSPKGVKADGNITLGGGRLHISVSGQSDGAEGLESKAILSVSGGETYVYAYDDAVNASSAINIQDGRLYAYSSGNDGIDSNGSLTLSGGTVITSGTTAPEGGLDVDNSNRFLVNGGIVIALGGTLQSTPSTSSTQRSVSCSALSLNKGTLLAVLDADGNPVLCFEAPRTLSNGSLFFSTPSIASNVSYTISSGGTLTLSAYASVWNGYYDGGTGWSGGTQLLTFTANSMVTTVGSSSTGFGGGNGGGMPGHW